MVGCKQIRLEDTESDFGAITLCTARGDEFKSTPYEAHVTVCVWLAKVGPGSLNREIIWNIWEQ